MVCAGNMCMDTVHRGDDDDDDDDNTILVYLPSDGAAKSPVIKSTMKAKDECEFTALVIHNINTGWRRVMRLRPRPFYPQ